MSESILPISEITEQEKNDLTLAIASAENPSLAGRISSVLGAPLEKGFRLLPNDWPQKIQEATNQALEKSLEFALVTLPQERHRSADFLNKVLAGASGALGGALGFATLAIELPVSTTIMLRSIADVARSEGADLNLPENRLACLEVLGLGAPPLSPNSPAADSAATPAVAETMPSSREKSLYWSYRDEIGSPLIEAATLIASRAIAKTSAPAIARFLAIISNRFSVLVSQQIAAKAVPVVGAAGGAIINVLFVDHFQEMARSHFTVKRLERKYGTKSVQELYMDLAHPAKDSE